MSRKAKDAARSDSWIAKLGARLKEAGRKMMVSLKRKPQIIPMLVFAAAFIMYSFKLTNISNTTAKVQGPGMGLCAFCIMLFSILSFVCFLNAFPHRKKVNVPMLILMFLMIGTVIYCDIRYTGSIETALNRAENPIPLDKSTEYIAAAYNMLNDHIIVLCVGVGLVVLLPLYSWLLRKINTSVEVEYSDDMAEIDISGEE